MPYVTIKTKFRKIPNKINNFVDLFLKILTFPTYVNQQLKYFYTNINHHNKKKEKKKNEINICHKYFKYLV